MPMECFCSMTLTRSGYLLIRPSFFILVVSSYPNESVHLHKIRITETHDLMLAITEFVDVESITMKSFRQPRTP